MALSLQGWLNGVSASGVVIFGCVLGLFYIYESKKTNAKLLFYSGFAIIFASLMWLADLVDFVTILLTGKNMDNSYGLWGILCLMWVPPANLLLIYICAELIIPEKKWYIVAISVVLGIIYEILLFLDPLSCLTYNYPATSGEDLIDESVVIESPFGIILFIMNGFLVIFCFFGLLIKAIQSKGVIRKKFSLLLIGQILFFIFAVSDGWFFLGIVLVFTRIGVFSSFWFFYLAFREEPEKTNKVSTKKEVKVKGDLFRISEYKKEDITEEKVSISKEKKICLVCKSKLGGLLFMCKECGAFYCEKCSDALSNLENACWVCETPFDESKPVKPFKREEEIDIEISEKPQKKPKTKK